MTVSVLVPYREGSEHRQRTWAWVRNFVSYLLPDAEIIAADSGDSEFSYGKSVDKAAAQAAGDTLFIVDADCVFTSLFPKLALEALAYGAAWCGTSEYVATTEAGGNYLLEQSPYQVINGMVRIWNGKQVSGRFYSPAGCIMLPRAAYEEVSGYDDRFEGWGWMDWAFFAALNTLVGQRVAIPDTVTIHIYHDRIAREYDENPHAEASRMLVQRYDSVTGNPESMRALIAERWTA